MLFREAKGPIGRVAAISLGIILPIRADTNTTTPFHEASVGEIPPASLQYVTALKNSAENNLRLNFQTERRT